MEALILVAHADDEALGCGGLIRKLVKKGWSTQVVVMSDGVFFRGETVDNRAGLKAACEILAVDAFRQMGFKDQRFDQISVSDFADSVLRLGLDPDLIVTHVGTDLNSDHRVTCDVAKIVGRPTRKPVSIIGCEIPNSSFWNGAAFPANYYVDVTEEIDTKIAAFAAYENEVRAFPHPWSEKALRLLAEYHGMQCGFRYAEAYSIIRAYEGRLP